GRGRPGVGNPSLLLRQRPQAVAHPHEHVDVRGVGPLGGAHAEDGTAPPGPDGCARDRRSTMSDERAPPRDDHGTYEWLWANWATPRNICRRAPDSVHTTR